MSSDQQPPPILRVACLDGFYMGDDAVLAAMNGPGLEAFTAALTHARERGVARLDCTGKIHTIRLQAGAADIALQDDLDDHVEWRLDHATVDEMIGKLTVMSGKGLCHNYIDIVTPADLLVVSLDEYLVPNPIVHTSPFGYF